MNTNMGSADRGIRAVIAVVIGGLYFMGMISGTTAIVLAVLLVIVPSYRARRARARAEGIADGD